METSEKVLLEYAFHRKDFVNEIHNKTTEIIRNFALIVYASENNLPTLNHWRGELLALINNFQDMETKPKRGNRDMVYKVIEQEWVTKLELPTHPLTIVHRFIGKFHDEGIMIGQNDMVKIAQTFINNMDELMNQMAHGTYDSSLAFVNSL